MNLLPIKLTDDNRSLGDLPDGIFGYTGADNLYKFKKDFDSLKLRVRADIEKTARKTEWYFKINKYSANKITFTGFVSDQADSLINQKKDLLNNDIQVFPSKFKEYVNEREFTLNDDHLIIRPRYISSGNNGGVQWLVDVSKVDMQGLFKADVHQYNTDEISKDVGITKEWYEKPLGILILTIVGTVMAAGIVYYFGWNK